MVKLLDFSGGCNKASAVQAIGVPMGDLPQPLRAPILAGGLSTLPTSQV